MERCEAQPVGSVVAAHKPGVDLAGGVVLPQQVRNFICVKIGSGGKSPARLSDGSEEDEAGKLRRRFSGHVPEGRLARGVVLPNQVRNTIAVEIGGGHHFPASQRGVRNDGVPEQVVAKFPSHEPYGDRARGLVLPDEIRDAISVEVGDGCHQPSLLTRAVKEGKASTNDASGASHIPDGDLTRRVVLEDQVWRAIAIEVSGACQTPPGESGSEEFIPEAAGIRSSHVPDAELA